MGQGEARSAEGRGGGTSGASTSGPPGFRLVVSGSIESASASSTRAAYCKYSLVAENEDWVLEEGASEGVTQLARSRSKSLVLNFPLEAAFHATSPYGWPQLVLAFYGPDTFGRDVARGYGRTHIPVAPGRYTKTVRLFKPLPSSLSRQLYGLLTGQHAEFVDPNFIARSDGREVTRVQGCGTATVRLNVLTRDMAVAGYSEEGAVGGKIGEDGSRHLG